VQIGGIPVGGGAPLVLIAGLNVIESADGTLRAAETAAGLARRHGLPLVFKASFDKANRSSLHSFRGPGLDEGLRILMDVRARTGVPTLTDVHEPGQAKPVAEAVDCLQVPAFLCRQTDLLEACAATGRAVNVKKGQFLAPDDARHVVEKLRAYGAGGVLVTERGVSFGHHDLVVDYRGFAAMRAMAPLCFDATHSAQRPGAGARSAGGNRADVPPLARAAGAVGIDALFVEFHPTPDRAPCDGPCQIDPAGLDCMLAEVAALDRALRAVRAGA